MVIVVETQELKLILVAAKNNYSKRINFSLFTDLILTTAFHSSVLIMCATRVRSPPVDFTAAAGCQSGFKACT